MTEANNTTGPEMTIIVLARNGAFQSQIERAVRDYTHDIVNSKQLTVEKMVDGSFARACFVVDAAIECLDVVSSIMTLSNRCLPIVTCAPQGEVIKYFEPRRLGVFRHFVLPDHCDDLGQCLKMIEKNFEFVEHYSQQKKFEMQKIERLTPREMEILGLMSIGYSNREIGERLEISHRTVEIHRAAVLMKLGTTNSCTAAALFCLDVNFGT